MALAFLGGCTTVPDSDPAGDAGSLAATWEKARFYLPGGLGPGRTGPVGRKRSDPAITHALAAIPAGVGIPTVLYLHGCSGFREPDRITARLLAGKGYAVIAPDSFARPGRPRTCDPAAHRTVAPPAVVERVYAMRAAEVDYALARIKELAWVDPKNLFLAGHSQGGTAAAAYVGHVFTGRVILGSRCARGFGAAADEPALAVHSARDPWLAAGKPRCKIYAGAAALETRELPGAEHVVVKVGQGRKAIIAFLARHTR